MDWDRVVDSARDAHFSKSPNNLVPFPYANRINVINVPGVRVFVGRYNFFQPFKSPVILRRVRTPEFISLFQMPQFNAENRCLYSVHAAIPPDHRVMVFANLAMIAKDSNFLLQLIVIGNHRPCLAKCAEILSGIKAKATCVAERAGPSPLVFGPMRLGRVFDDVEAARARNLKNRVHVRRLTEKMDGNDRLGPLRYGLFQTGRVHGVGAFININKHRLCAAIGNRLSSRHERAGNREHFVSRPDPQCEECQPKRLRAAPDADGMRAIAVRGEILFEPRDERPAGERSAVNNLSIAA